jgi:hypothetical protein
MAARSEVEVTSLLVYKSPAWKGGDLYCDCRLATLAREASFVREWGCWFHVVRKHLRELNIRNLQPETLG